MSAEVRSFRVIYRQWPVRNFGFIFDYNGRPLEDFKGGGQ